MKFEYKSKNRDRNEFPSCGNFYIEAALGANNRTSAFDPVCDAAPMISWTPTFSLSGTISSCTSCYEVTELIVNFSNLGKQFMTTDFLCGCVLSNSSYSARISHSYFLPSISNQFNLRIHLTNLINFTIGSTVSISDYTSFDPLNVRAPTNFDFGNFKILYNETTNQFINIASCDLYSRELYFSNPNVVGWSNTDNLNLRNAPPQQISTIASATSTSVTLNSTPSFANLNDWIRLRLGSYTNANPTDSWFRQITSINGNTLTFYPALASIPSINSTIEILTFSYDNAFPVQVYDKSLIKPYYATLETLSVPNVQILNGNLQSTDYLNIEFNNQSAISHRHLINSNNPLVSESIWVAKLDPNSLKNSKLRFVMTESIQHSQKLLLNLNEAMHLIVKLSNGQYFQTLIPDTVSPQPPWPDLNISFIFDFQDDASFFETKKRKVIDQ